jgi:hypothetical protein
MLEFGMRSKVKIWYELAKTNGLYSDREKILNDDIGEGLDVRQVVQQ